MRHTTTLSVAVSSFAVPLLAFAAYGTPSELLKAAQFKGEAMDVAYEAHGRMDDLYISAWLRGAVEGKDIETTKADLRLTGDLATPDGTVRVKLQLKVVDAAAYVMIESIDGRFSDAHQNIALQFSERQWYSLDLSREELSSFRGLEEDEVEQVAWDVLDRVLSIERLADGKGSVYSLKLKRNAWKEVIPVIEDAGTDPATPMMTPREERELRKVFAKLNLHVKVMTDAADAPTGMKFYAAMTDRTWSFVFQGLATLRERPVTVRAPADAIPLDDARAVDASLGLADARDAQRRSDVNTILNAVYQYAIDNNGDLPAGIPMNTPKEICRSTQNARACAGKVNLDVLLESYLVTLPTDPQVTSGAGTGYRIWQDRNYRITVEAPHAEGEEVITITR